MDDSEVHIASRSIHVDCHDPPQVSFTPLKGQDLPSRSKPWTESELPMDILLLTVKDCEFLSCISYLNPGYHKSYHKNLGYVYFGKMGKEECLKVAVMECFVGSGPAASCITVKNAVALLKPKCVFCVGFCSGLNIFNEVKLGDVVISGKYLTETKTKNQKRSVSIPLSSRIASIIKRAADGWSPPLIDPKEREVNVHVGGLFLSGTEEELNNVEQREELVKRFPQATAIVTESEGLFRAAHDLQMEWIVVKGVSDFADGRKLNTVAWRIFASVMAASLTFHILGDVMVFKDWPHYEVPSADESKRKKKEAATCAYK